MFVVVNAGVGHMLLDYVEKPIIVHKQLSDAFERELETLIWSYL